MRFRKKEKGDKGQSALGASSSASSREAPVLPFDEKPELSWIDFSNPTNPLGTPPTLIEALKDALAAGIASRQPDRNAWALRTALARLYDLPPESFICGSSVSDLLRAVLQMIEPGPVGVPIPCLPDYLSAMNAAGHRPVLLSHHVDLRAHDAARTARQAGIAGALLSNPSFPTSRLLPKATLAGFLDVCSWVLVDERFVELSIGGETVVPLTRDYPNLLVIRSLSESFAIPGTPVSYCVGHPSVIERMRPLFDSASISVFSEVLGNAAMGEIAYLERARDLLEAEIPWLQCMLGLIPGITVSPAEAGFLLCSYRPDRDAGAAISEVDELARRLQTRGIIIGRLDGVPGVEGNVSFCVAIRTHAENERLVHALREVLAHQET